MANTLSLVQARRDAPGETITLSLGATYYELAGPANAPLVVLIHGFSVPSYVWDPTFASLPQSGLRVLRYDLYGRGLSDRPKTRYSRELFVNQLHELLSALSITQPVHLVGLSMGGPVAAGFAAEHPEQTATLSLLAPAGMMEELPAGMRFLRWFLVGETIMLYRGQEWLTTSLEHDLYHRDRLRAYVSRYRQQMRWPGFKRAILSTIRHGPLRGQRQIYAQVARQGTPTLLIWGEQDHTVPFQLHETLQDILPHASFYAIAEAGHIAHFEQPEVVGPLLIDHVQANAS